MRWIGHRQASRHSRHPDDGQVAEELQQLRAEVHDLKSAKERVDQLLKSDARFASLLEDASAFGANLFPESVTMLQAELQAKIAVMQLQSSEQVSGQLKRASWALVWATLGLVFATAVLIWVTAT